MINLIVVDFSQITTNGQSWWLVYSFVYQFFSAFLTRQYLTWPLSRGALFKAEKKNSVGESDTQLNLNHYLLKTRLYNKAFLIEISQIGLLITLNQHSPPQAATPIKNSLFLPVWLTQQSVNGVWTRRRLRKIWHFWIFSCSKEVLIAKKTLIGFSTQLTVN